MADAPPDAEWRGALVDQVALLRADSSTGNGGGGDPNRLPWWRKGEPLDANPNDLEGWLRLIPGLFRAGRLRRRRGSSITRERTVFANQAQAQAALAEAAKENATELTGFYPETRPFHTGPQVVLPAALAAP